MVATLSADQLDALWAKLDGPLEEPRPAEEVTEPEYKAIASGYFKWLREFVDPACVKRLGCPAADIPVRVSLPSFGNMNKAELLLTEILSEAGWTLDRTAPTLPEPLSNAIGTFSEGVNATNLRGEHPNYGRMFEKTGMIGRMRKAILEDGPTSAWVLIVDIGGYTTDFAMAGIDLTAIDARLSGTADGRKRLAHKSTPLGVAELDRRLLGILSPARQEALAALLHEPDQQRLEAFHRGCYGPLGRYALRSGGVIGGTTGEKKAVRDVIQAFADQAADDAERFLEIHQYDRIDDLILTGGGTLIPLVRDTLGARLSGHADPKTGLKVHTYFTERETLFSIRNLHRLSYPMVRGATAVGGASVYFDFATDG